MSQKIQDRICLQRPKRLLSIDGGGIRGLIAVEILQNIEDIICKEGTPWHCLADYFDFIGGTSTGSIIAAGLAKGMKVQEISELYHKRGEAIFTPHQLDDKLRDQKLDELLDPVIKKFGVWWPLDGWLKDLAKHKFAEWIMQENKNSPAYQLALQFLIGSFYTPKILEAELKKKFPEDMTLDSDELKTLLLITTKNATNGKTFFFSNNPNSDFFQNNKTIPLWNIIRASAAAPTYFPPHTFSVGSDQNEFIDGGMSMYNNPSFQLFLEAALNDYKIGWETGLDKIFMISIGTGFSSNEVEFEKAKNYKIQDWGGYSVGTLMEDANLGSNTLMKLISKELDGKDNDDKPSFNNTNNGEVDWLTYRRYTISFNDRSFENLQKYGLPKDIKPESVKPMDCVDKIKELSEIGKAVAKQQVRPEHFQNFLHDDQGNKYSL